MRESIYCLREILRIKSKLAGPALIHNAAAPSDQLIAMEPTGVSRFNAIIKGHFFHHKVTEAMGMLEIEHQRAQSREVEFGIDWPVHRHHNMTNEGSPSDFNWRQNRNGRKKE